MSETERERERERVRGIDLTFPNKQRASCPNTHVKEIRLIYENVMWSISIKDGGSIPHIQKQILVWIVYIGVQGEEA